MIYVGTTSFSRHKRTQEYWKDVTRVKGASAVMKHYEEGHIGLQLNFVCTLEGTYLQTLRRYVTEALMLDRFARTHRVMNKRSEWGKIRLPRIGVVNR